MTPSLTSHCQTCAQHCIVMYYQFLLSARACKCTDLSPELRTPMMRRLCVRLFAPYCTCSATCGNMFAYILCSQLSVHQKEHHTTAVQLARSHSHQVVCGHTGSIELWLRGSNGVHTHPMIYTARARHDLTPRKQNTLDPLENTMG